MSNEKAALITPTIRDREPISHPLAEKIAPLAEGITPLFQVSRSFCPSKTVMEENELHRSMCLLRCEGYRAKEIAEKLGYSHDQVKVVLRQPWAQKFILETIHKNAQEGLDKLYKRYEAEALEVAHEIMQETENEKLRATMSIELLKVARGQHITVDDRRKSLDDLKQEEELLDAQLKALGGERGSN